MKRRMKLVFVAALPLLAFAAGCYARRGETVGRVPELDEEELRGRDVYMRMCQKCHPEGRAGLAPGIVDKPLPGALMKLQIRKGIGAMPGFSEEVISGSELDDLVDYVKLLRHAGARR